MGYISGNAHTVRTSVPVRVLRTPTPVVLRTKLTALRIADFCVLCIADSLSGFRKADTSFLPDCGVTRRTRVAEFSELRIADSREHSALRTRAQVRALRSQQLPRATEIRGPRRNS